MDRRPAMTSPERTSYQRQEQQHPREGNPRPTLPSLGYVWGELGIREGTPAWLKLPSIGDQWREQHEGTTGQQTEAPTLDLYRQSARPVERSGPSAPGDAATRRHNRQTDRPPTTTLTPEQQKELDEINERIEKLKPQLRENDLYHKRLDKLNETEKVLKQKYGELKKKEI